jgi:hypothetical protein
MFASTALAIALPYRVAKAGNPSALCTTPPATSAAVLGGNRPVHLTACHTSRIILYST